MEVVVVAPAENQTGTSDSTTPGRAHLRRRRDPQRRRGHGGGRVPGRHHRRRPRRARPRTRPRRVRGQPGPERRPLAYLSGTVGAGRTAVRRGIPAVAGSAGLREDTDFEARGRRSSSTTSPSTAPSSPTAPPTDARRQHQHPRLHRRRRPGAARGRRWPPSSPRGSNPFETRLHASAPTTTPTDDVAAMVGRPRRPDPRPAGGTARLIGFPGPIGARAYPRGRAAPRPAEGLAREAHARAVRGRRPARRALVDRRLQGHHRRPPHRRGPDPAPPGDPHLRGRGPVRPRHHRPRLGRGDRQRRRDPRRAAVLEGHRAARSGSCSPCPGLARSEVADLPQGVRVSSEYPELTRRYFEKHGIEADIRLSYGATEAKVPDIVDCIVDGTETGRALRAAGLKIIDDVLTELHGAGRQPRRGRRPGQAPRHGADQDAARRRDGGAGQGAGEAQRGPSRPRPRSSRSCRR